VKRGLTLLVVIGAVFALAAWLVTEYQAKYVRQLAAQKAQWDLERTQLEASLEAARQRPEHANLPVTPATPTPVPVPQRPTPEEIVARLRALRSMPGGPLRQQRAAVYWLEELAQAGPAAWPAIRQFLAAYEDIELDTSFLQARGARDRIPLEFSVPPSLRLGMFELLRRSGGVDAFVILAESLVATGRGIEVSYLAGALQEMAPNQYRDKILEVARTLLAQPAPVTSASPLDRNHRDYLFGVLAMFSDTGFVTEAQTQLVRTDSQVDRGALKYLQQVLGPQAVPLAASAYQNPLLTNSAGKEPLARLALNYVGADAQANAFYEQTINDPILNRSHRKNLIEDLNQDGFGDTRNLTAKDLPLIENRIRLIEQLAPSSMDEVNAAAFKEAYKDLLNMRTKITGLPPPAATSPPKP
jgi:hypothetical protein